MSKSREPLEIPSIEWFTPEVRAAALRLLAAGTSDHRAAVLDETMTHPRLRDIVSFLFLFGYGAVNQHHGGVTSRTNAFMANEQDVAELARQLDESDKS